jgi:hypothetical protein
VKFTLKRADNGDSALWITDRGWTKDANVTAAGPSCSVADNPCRRPVLGSGTMWAVVNLNGRDYYTTAHVTVYSSFGLDADRTTVEAGDTVIFTPKYDGVVGPAARWRFAPTDTSTHDTTACADGVSPCKKAMLTSGTMWVYTSPSSGGDSASAAVVVQCATTDAVLNNPVVRIFGDSIWKLHMPPTQRHALSVQCLFLTRPVRRSFA